MRAERVCQYRLAINRCQKCSKCLKCKKLENREVSAGKTKEANKFKTKQSPLNTHKCFKTFGGTSKVMESDSIIKMVLNFPSKKGVYIIILCMDDDATTPARLKEDEGPDSKGRLPK